jgi:hypothetical protein
MKELMEDIIKNKIFGRVTSNIMLKEFQKRRLLIFQNMFILFILYKTDKPKTADAYHKLIFLYFLGFFNNNKEIPLSQFNSLCKGDHSRKLQKAVTNSFFIPA